MKRLLLILAVMLALPYSAKADMLTGGTFPQFTVGLNTSIKPEFALRPTIGIRTWFQVDKWRFAIEGTAFSSQLAVDDSTKTGWGTAAYLKIRSVNFGSAGVIHILAKGGISTEEGNWKMQLDESQYQVGPVFDVDFDGRKEGANGLSTELGLYWMSASGVVDQLGVQAQLVVDFQ